MIRFYLFGKKIEGAHENWAVHVKSRVQKRAPFGWRPSHDSYSQDPHKKHFVEKSNSISSFTQFIIFKLHANRNSTCIAHA